MWTHIFSIQPSQGNTTTNSGDQPCLRKTMAKIREKTDIIHIEPFFTHIILNVYDLKLLIFLFIQLDQAFCLF
jgi:hypothetical protein